MSNADSGIEAENGQIDSAPVAPCALAALPSQHLEKLIHENNWHNPDSPDFHERILARQYRFPQSDVDDLRPLSDSQSITTSMAVSISTARSSAFTNPRSAGCAPSLVSGSTRRSDQSVRTSRADSVLALETLDDNADGISDGGNFQPRRSLPCCYSFMSCNFSSRNLETWDTHCKSHFYGRLPRLVDCPFECDWSREAATGEQAWQARLIHIWSVHGLDGFVDTGRRPSSALIQHLWKEGIIDKAQLKELRMTGRLTGSQAFLTSAGAVREERIRRHQRAGVRS